MPFENFYREADQYSHRWRLCLISAIFFIAAYFGFPILVSWILTPSKPNLKFEPAVNKPDAGDAAALCRTLPKPERLSMTAFTENKTNDGAAQIVYSYQSERAPDEVMPQFLIWLDAEGGERVFDEVYGDRADGHKDLPDRALNFRDGNRRVSVLYFDLQKNDFNPFRQAQFEIVCTVEKFQPRD